MTKRETNLILAFLIIAFFGSVFQIYRIRQQKEIPAKAAGDYHYVRAGATGLNNGSDWTNAWTTLPATLVRGDTYYIADGTYGSYTFDDAVNGELYITIKKATSSDHGTNTGWDASYGDGQGVWNAASGSTFIFSTGYYIINGQTGGGPGQWDSGHGFKLTGPKGQRSVDLRGPNWWRPPMPTNIEFRHIEFRGYGLDVYPGDSAIYQAIQAVCAGGEKSGTACSTDAACPGSYCNDEGNGTKYITVSHCYLHDFGVTMATRYAKNWTVENNYFARNSVFMGQCLDDGNGDTTGICRDVMVDESGPRTCSPIGSWVSPGNGCPNQHSEAWSDYGSDNVIIRNNLFSDIEGTAFIALMGYHNAEKPCENWDIYGNVFYYTSGNPYGRDGASVGVIGASSGDVVNNIRIYNNSFINIPGLNTIGYFEAGSTGVQIYNNIWQNSSAIAFSANAVHDYNLFYGNYDYRNGLNTDSSLVSSEPHSVLGTGDSFVNWQNKDFRLSSPTNPGLTLSSPYNTDMLGNIRGLDGNWDRGAYEYVSSTPTPTPTPTPTYQSGDLNSDTRVNSIDFGIMMSYWGALTKPKSDINQDGYVNSVDFGIMLSQWTG